MSADDKFRTLANLSHPGAATQSESHGAPAMALPDVSNDSSKSIRSPRDPQAAPSGMCHLVIIEPRALLREALVLAIRATTEARISAFATAEQWQAESAGRSPDAVMLGIPGRPRDPDAQRQLAIALHCSNNAPVIIMAGAEEPDQIVETLERGARGYVPTSLPLAVAVLALRMVAEGGVYIPASSLLVARRQLGQNRGPNARGETELFTGRQVAVVEALSRGKANKVIAYELNMCESTVKVHVRNIMKKLKAKNRTEVAFIANSLLAARKELAGAKEAGTAALRRDQPSREIERS